MSEINRDLDTTPLPPNNLVAQDPQSAELAGYVRTKTFGRDVRESIARSIELNSTRSKSAEILASETLAVTKTATSNMANQVELIRAEKDAVIANATVDSEVILARGGKDTLGQRLDETDTQLAHMAISVKSFGAKGDKVTDDTVAIQQAIDEAIRLGAPLYIPAGEYTVSSTLNLNTNSNGITIYGTGKDLSLIHNVSDTTTIDFGERGIAKNIVIRDLGFIGVENAVTPSSAIELKHGPSTWYTWGAVVNIENVVVNGGYNGIAFDSIITSSFKNVLVTNCSNDGFVGTNYVTSTLFENCYANNVGRYGYHTRASYTTFQNCACDHPGSDAYHIIGGWNVNFNACDAEFVNGYGIYVESTTYISITGSNITSIEGEFPLIYLKDSRFINILNLYGAYSTEATVNSIILDGTSGSLTLIGGFINRNGGNKPYINDNSTSIFINHRTTGIGIGKIPGYGLELFDTNNIKAMMGVPGVANWYFRVNSNGSFGIAKNATDSGSIILQSGSKDKSLVVTKTGVKIGGDTAEIANLRSINAGFTAWNVGTIANSSIASKIVPVTGAEIGDQVVVGFSNALGAGLILTGNVTATDTVTVTLLNMTGSSQTINSGTIKVTVIKSS